MGSPSPRGGKLTVNGSSWLPGVIRHNSHMRYMGPRGRAGGFHADVPQVGNLRQTLPPAARPHAAAPLPSPFGGAVADLLYELDGTRRGRSVCTSVPSGSWHPLDVGRRGGR